MCSQWVNKYEILRDLSHAQGCVPVEVAGAVAAADQPPSPKIVEQNEEEFYRDCVGDGGHLAPDITLIKHMLRVVHEFDIIHEDDSQVIQISNYNPLTCKQPKKKVPPALENKKPKPKRKNVAIASILQKQKEEQCLQNDNKQLKLLKPEDFSNNEDFSNHNCQAIEKVNGWFETQAKHIVTNKTSHTLDMDPSLMFRKQVASPKTLQNPIVKHTVANKKSHTLDMDPSSMFRKRVASPKTPQKPVDVNVISPPHTCKNYVPSTQAEEYYKELQKKIKMKKMLDENVWTNVEKEMKEIDERRKQFSLCLKKSKSLDTSSEPTFCKEFEDQKFEAVRLPFHRHLLPDDCVICAVKIYNEEDKAKLQVGLVKAKTLDN